MSAIHELGVWFPTVRTGTGTDVFTERLVEGLQQRGIRAEITWLPLRTEYASWTVRRLKLPSWATLAHVNSWLPRHMWPSRVPVVVTVHHLVHDPAYAPFRSPAQAAYHELLIRRRELSAIRDAAAVTAISNYVRDTVKVFSRRMDIVTIYNWVDCDKFSPRPTQPSREGNRFRLFMAGSHSRRKGFDLLPAFVKALGTGFEIRYAGNPASAGAPIAGVTELGRISNNTLIDEYRACDAVVSLSRYEGFGYTALEALACGKPFLGFDTSALPEVTEPDCGCLVPVGDVAALAVATRRLRAHPDIRHAMGVAGRGRAVSCFGLPNIEAYVTVYARSLASSDLHSGRWS